MNITKVSPEFAQDLIELVNSLKGITYNAKVNYTNRSGQTIAFEYVTLDKIYSKIKENNNFAVLQPLGTDEHGESAVQVILIHKSGEAITSDYYKIRVNEHGSKQDEGAAITYTKRYALGSFLGLCTDEDNDANPTGKGMDLKSTQQQKGAPPTGNRAQKGRTGSLTDKQISRLNAKSIAAGVSQEQLASHIAKKYKKSDPKQLTREEYDELCAQLDAAAAKGGQSQ